MGSEMGKLYSSGVFESFLKLMWTSRAFIVFIRDTGFRDDLRHLGMLLT